MFKALNIFWFQPLCCTGWPRGQVPPICATFGWLSTLLNIHTAYPWFKPVISKQHLTKKALRVSACLSHVPVSLKAVHRIRAVFFVFPVF